jgi:hypothetical protein
VLAEDRLDRRLGLCFLDEHGRDPRAVRKWREISAYSAGGRCSEILFRVDAVELAALDQTVEQSATSVPRCDFEP